LRHNFINQKGDKTTMTEERKTTIGQDTREGFLPSLPELDDILERIEGVGWEGMDRTVAGERLKKHVDSSHDTIRRDFAAMYRDPVGRRVIEFLLDKTLRIGCSHPNKSLGFEQEALYSRERHGQNSIVVVILKMIHDGLLLPPPGSSAE
jgi:hypothetical protein